MAVVLPVVIPASPAYAHAGLRSTRPTGGTAVDEAPLQVVLQFTQAVEVSLGAVRVFDASARRIDDGRARHAPGDASRVVVDLPEIDQGSYVVAWRIVSSDAHTARGAFTFTVGTAPSTEGEALARRLLAAGGGSPLAGALWVADRMLGFAALIVLVGGAFFVSAVWPAGSRSSRVRRLLGSAWAAAWATTAVGVGLQAVALSALPAADVLRPSVWSAAVDTRFGRLGLARLALLVLAAVLVGPRLRRAPERAKGAVVVAGGALLATVSLAGHASSGAGAGLAVGVDVLHLGAASAWVGGLAMLGRAVLSRSAGTGQAEAGHWQHHAPYVAVVARFSRLAAWCVAVVVATGLYQSWRQVGTLDALTSTTYGRLLGLKVALVAGVVAVGWVSRDLLRRRLSVPALRVPAAVAAVAAGGVGGPSAVARPGNGPDGDTMARLRRSVVAEVALAAAVVTAAALLANVAPARYTFARPYSTEVTAGPVLLNLTLDPARAGTTDLHVYALDPEGTVREVGDVFADLRLPAQEVGPIAVPLRRAGPGHFAAYSFTLPTRGTWELALEVELVGGERVTATAALPVEK